MPYENMTKIKELQNQNLTINSTLHAGDYHTQ